MRRHVVEHDRRGFAHSCGGHRERLRGQTAHTHPLRVQQPWEHPRLAGDVPHHRHPAHHDHGLSPVVRVGAVGLGGQRRRVRQHTLAAGHLRHGDDRATRADFDRAPVDDGPARRDRQPDRGRRCRHHRHLDDKLLAGHYLLRCHHVINQDLAGPTRRQRDG